MRALINSDVCEGIPAISDKLILDKGRFQANWQFGNHQLVSALRLDCFNPNRIGATIFGKIVNSDRVRAKGSKNICKRSRK